MGIGTSGSLPVSVAILPHAFVADNHCVGQTLVSHIGEEEEAEEEDETVIPGQYFRLPIDVEAAARQDETDIESDYGAPGPLASVTKSIKAFEFNIKGNC